ncbi:MAG: hypothetical protein JNL13_06170 [Chitinophagaceae bacterium]|nr:hypothetical protein [Chitinophagaceae bacterium]
MVTADSIRQYIRNNTIELKCTQRVICTPMVDRFCRKMSAGIRFPNINVFEGYICDGHHRYLASLLSGVAIGINPSRITAATEIIDWRTLTFHEEDYYPQEAIDELNRQDAMFNNISIAEIVEILK